jgi:twitching motility protein PilU
MKASDFGDPHDLSPYLQFMVRAEASDLFLTVGAPPSLKVRGAIRPMDLPALTHSDAKALAYSVMCEAGIREFESTLECDFATTIEGLGRFRFTR